MWKYILGPGRTQMTIWRMRIACWITKATDTLRICNTYCLPTATMVTRTRLNILLYVHWLSCCTVRIRNMATVRSWQFVTELKWVNILTNKCISETILCIIKYILYINYTYIDIILFYIYIYINIYWTVHHCNSWGIRNQLDVTCYIYCT